jgi:hypothetical protein
MFASLLQQSRERAPPYAFYRPYKNPGINQLYNLLFCDNFTLFASGDAPAGPLVEVLSDAPDREDLERIGNDPEVESRVRALAFRRLQGMNVSVPSGRLLGMILEWPQESGLDVLAAFPDGRLRYINRSEKLAIVDATPPDLVEQADELLRVSQHIVDRSGPWGRPRLPPPSGDLIRMNFLVSDGLYFGQGSYSALMEDAFAPPVINAAILLLEMLVEPALAKDKRSRVLH